MMGLLASGLISDARKQIRKIIGSSFKAVDSSTGGSGSREPEVVERLLQEEVERYVQLILDLYLRGWASEVSPVQTLDKEVENDLRRALTEMADAFR